MNTQIGAVILFGMTVVGGVLAQTVEKQIDQTIRLTASEADGGGRG